MLIRRRPQQEGSTRGGSVRTGPAEFAAHKNVDKECAKSDLEAGIELPSPGATTVAIWPQAILMNKAQFDWKRD